MKRSRPRPFVHAAAASTNLEAFDMTRRLCLLLCCAAACGGGSGATGGVATRDTLVSHRGAEASIRIVENPEHPAAGRPAWRLADTPDVDIGGEAGTGATPLFGVAGAARLSDGRIVVADGGSMTLRVFGPGGRERAAIGRAGQGPGEFKRFTHLGLLPGDSLVVADFGLARISVFDAAGSLTREARWGDRPGSPRSSVIGVFGDGSLLSRGFVTLEGQPRGLLRHSTAYYHLAPDGTLADSLGEFPGDEAYFTPIENGFTVEDARFPRTSSFVASGNRFYVAMSERYEVHVFSADGTPRLRIRRAHRPRPVRPSDLAAERQSRLGAVSGEPRRTHLERLLAEMPVPETMQTFDRIAVDADLNVWVRDYRPAWEPGADTWTVFDPDGRITARVATPPRLEPLQIARGFLLGLWKDEQDVEHVRLYRILTSG